MPQASDELRAEMKRRFGDPVDDTGPINYLRERGFTLHSDWVWSKPGCSPAKGITQSEWDCICFLADEWDFGGLMDLTNQPQEPTP